MQHGGVTTSDAYRVSGRVLIDGADIGAHVESVSVDRDIPSGLPGDTGFTSATGTVTATWGDMVSDRVDHPWTVQAQDPPVTTFEWAGTPHASESIKKVDGVEVARNLATNPSFEVSATAGMVLGSRVNTHGRTTIVARVHAGTYSSSFSWAEDATQIQTTAQTDVDAAPGQWVAVSVWATSNNGQIYADGIISERTTGGSHLAHHYQGAYQSIGNSEMTRIVYAVQVNNPSVQRARVGLRFSGTEGSYTAPASGYGYLDAFHVAVADTEVAARAQVAEYFDGDTPDVPVSRPVWPPRPGSRVEVRLSDGVGGEWTQLKGVITDPSGSTSTRTISFGVRDNYRALDRLVTIPALARSMPALHDANDYRYIGLHSTFITDWVLRQAGRYATAPMGGNCFISATFQGSTWPERGSVFSSIRHTPDELAEAYPSWQKTPYGMCARNLEASYRPGGTGPLAFDRPMEVTQELVNMASGSAFLYIHVGTGRLAIAQTTTTAIARYYPLSGGSITLASRAKNGATRVAVRWSRSGQTLTAQLRFREADGTLSDILTGTATIDSGDMLGNVTEIRVTGNTSHGGFQAGFPTTAWAPLRHDPTAVIHAAMSGRNHLVGFPTQVNVNALDLLNDQADAEFGQWWIDEHDILQWWDRGLLAQQPVVGVLTGQDHVKSLSWSHDADSARRRVHVQYKHGIPTNRWRTNLVLWQGTGETLETGDTSEIFVNCPDDEIWLGVDHDNPTRYSANTPNYWVINRGIRSVMGGIAVDDEGNERLTNSVIPTLRRITDDTFLFEHTITALLPDEQAVLSLPTDPDADPALWRRNLGEKLPILRGKKKITRVDTTATSSITGDSSAPDYTHDGGDFIDEPVYAGLTADYAAASLTQPRPTLGGIDIMPVLALQVGDRVVVHMPEVMGLQVDGVVTSISVSADFGAGTASQQISLTPRAFCVLGGTWTDFGMVYQGRDWSDFATEYAGDRWAGFGDDWDGCDPPVIPGAPPVSWYQFGAHHDDDTWQDFGADRAHDTWHSFGADPLNQN